MLFHLEIAFLSNFSTKNLVYKAFYSALKKNDILIPATIYMNLENMILSKISQTQKDKIYYSTYMRYLEYSNS